MYWNKKFAVLNEENRIGEFKLQTGFTDSDQLVHKMTTVNGLPFKEAVKVCKEMYAKNIAKVTIEIATGQVMKTKKEMAVTFAEQLSIISKGIQL